MPSVPTILIVDDCADTICLVSLFLRNVGFRVMTADNGMDGLRRALTERPDCVITDLLMPALSGFRLLDLLKSESEYQPHVLMMSAIDEPSQRAYAQALGVDGFLTKPFGLDQLFEHLARLFPAVTCNQPWAAGADLLIRS